MNLKILIVEDNVDTRQLLAMLLASTGDEVRAAGSVQAALEAFDASPVEVLVSDMGPPDGSGHELMHRLHGRGHDPYGIAITGYAAANDVEASLSAGYRRHLVKPIDFDELERLIESVRDELASAPPS